MAKKEDDKRVNNSRPVGSTEYDEPKKKRKLTLTDTAWAWLDTYRKQIKLKSRSELLEKAARGQMETPF